jgi:hypothetical protein
MKIKDSDFKGIWKRLNNIVSIDNNNTAASNNTDNTNNTTTTILFDADKYILSRIKDDTYYESFKGAAMNPPRIWYCKHVRFEKLDEETKYRLQHDSSFDGSGDSMRKTITQEELDYSLKMKLKVPPEERYQKEKEAEYSHKLSYIHTKIVEDNSYSTGKRYVNIVKEYGCGRGWADSKPQNEGGGWCVPECRYYPAYGRIEDEEVIAEHNKFVESYRQKDAIILIDMEDEKVKKDYVKYLKENPNILNL